MTATHAAPAHPVAAEERPHAGVLLLSGGDEEQGRYGHLREVLSWAGYDVHRHDSADDTGVRSRVDSAARRGDRVVLVGSGPGALRAVQLARSAEAAVAAVVAADLPGPVDQWGIDAGPGTVPTLVLHGARDASSPSLPARSLVAGWSRARFITVADSAQDVLHGVHARSVALEVARFLETVRMGKEPLRTSIRSTW